MASHRRLIYNIRVTAAHIGCHHASEVLTHLPGLYRVCLQEVIIPRITHISTNVQRRFYDERT
jgi:hypothetical protein